MKQQHKQRSEHKEKARNGQQATTVLDGILGALELNKDLDLFSDLDDLEIDFVTLPAPDTLTQNVTSKLEERKETNAERCRRQRLKRKEREKEIQSENRLLKEERSQFLKTISDLEYEVQVSRGQGVVDLKAENELLRTEIEKHQAYIQNVLKATRNIPLQTRDEVNERMLRGGIESGIAQVVGLAYSSTSEGSWQPAKCDRISHELDCEFELWYQYLPIGSTSANAKRANLRFDAYSIGLSPEKIFEDYWDSYSKERYMNDKKVEYRLKGEGGECTGGHHDIDVGFEEIIPNTKVDVSHVARFIKVSSPRVNPTRVGALALVTKVVKMFPAAFRRHQAHEDPTQPEEVRVVCKTSCDIGLLPGGSNGKQKLKNLNFGGSIYRKRDGQTDFTFINSFPVDSDFEKLTGLSVRDMLAEDGTLHPRACAFMLGYIKKMLAPLKEAEAAE